MLNSGWAAAGVQAAAGYHQEFVLSVLRAIAMNSLADTKGAIYTLTRPCILARSMSFMRFEHGHQTSATEGMLAL